MYMRFKRASTQSTPRKSVEINAYNFFVYKTS
jgi:hypothetical protein